MTVIDRSPPRLAIGIVGAIGIGIGIANGVFSTIALGGGILGIGIVLGSVQRLYRRGVSVGMVLLVGASLFAGMNGSPVSVTLACLTGTIVVWDVSRTAMSLGGQVGRRAPTTMVVIRHTIASLAVGTVSAIGGYGVFVNTPSELSPAAVVFLVGAVVFLLIGLRRGTEDALST